MNDAAAVLAADEDQAVSFENSRRSQCREARAFAWTVRQHSNGGKKPARPPLDASGPTATVQGLKSHDRWVHNRREGDRPLRSRLLSSSHDGRAARTRVNREHAWRVTRC